jgi:hypothetical protein
MKIVLTPCINTVYIYHPLVPFTLEDALHLLVEEDQLSEVK